MLQRLCTREGQGATFLTPRRSQRNGQTLRGFFLYLGVGRLNVLLYPSSAVMTSGSRCRSIVPPLGPRILPRWHTRPHYKPQKLISFCYSSHKKSHEAIKLVCGLYISRYRTLAKSEGRVRTFPLTRLFWLPSHRSLICEYG